MVTKPPRPVPDLDGSTLVHHSANLYVDSVTGMVLSRVGSTKATGYEYVCADGRERTAHRLVWEALHGPIDAGKSINHRDGVKTNNRPDNLEQATPSEQIRHAYAIGLRSGNGCAGRWRGSRLTDEQIATIRAAPRGTITDLAAEFGISREWAYQIRGGRGPGITRGRSRGV